MPIYLCASNVDQKQQQHRRHLGNSSATLFHRFVPAFSLNFLLILMAVQIGASSPPQQSRPVSSPVQSFASWINRTQAVNGLFLNHNQLAEGEVLLFRTKKSRHRAVAIPVMTAATFGRQQPKTRSKFSDALTFKEWLRHVYQQDKALKVSVRTTDVMRPVLLHLYASKTNFQAPIIVHANTFESSRSSEGPVDAVQFIETVKRLLPEAVVSLGWTPSSDYAAVNSLDWAQTLQLVSLVHGLSQPVILNMRLNDAVHSAQQLEWLLGVEDPPVYLLLKGELTDFVDSDRPLEHLARLGTTARRKVLFDVDESWRMRLKRISATPPTRKGRRSVEPDRWMNVVFPSAHSTLSTSVVSMGGVAFLGWPSSLLVSTREPMRLPARQRITGKVMFVPKNGVHSILPADETGLQIQLFDGDPDPDPNGATAVVDSLELQNAIRVFLGYNGRVHIEQQESGRVGQRPEILGNFKIASASAQLPRARCYGFEVWDRGWRVEMEAWTERCAEEDREEEEDGTEENGERERVRTRRNRDYEAEDDESAEDGWVSQRTYVKLDTPMTKSLRIRSVAVGKSGDGAIDFLLRKLEHSGSARLADASSPSILFIALMIFQFLRLLLL